MRFNFEAVEELALGPRWAGLFASHWPAYRKWFLADGDAARPSYLESLHKLRTHMPELVPTYEEVCELAGGGDVAARFLALYRPPAFLSGCSQAVWLDDGGSVLVRNYDYHPALLEGICLHTCWNGKQVIALSDCSWGVLDGMNDDGLAVSLAFGGSRAVGDGFGVPLVLRYVLEFCSTVAEACAALMRVPVHMAYNITMLDASDAFRTVYLFPGEKPVIRQFPVATNHQGSVAWMEHAHATQTLERERVLYARYASRDQSTAEFIDSFLRPPIFSRAYRRGYGTLYTSIYRPALGQMQLRWPDQVLAQSFKAFRERVYVARFRDPAQRRADSGAPASSTSSGA